MTAAAAATCPEGVVLVGDSMRWYYKRGSHEVESASLDRKVEWIGERIAAIPSGTFSKAVPLASLHRKGVELSVTEAATAVQKILAPTFRTSEGPRDTAAQLEDVPDVLECLVAGGPRGAMPQLAVVRGERIEHVGIGEIRLTACMRGSRELGGAVAMPNPYATLEETAARVVFLMQKRILEIYRAQGCSSLEDYRRTGAVPLVAYPLSLVVITPDEVVTLSLEEPGAEELREPLASAS